jgi:dTDP-4-amino-4,6-dideoxygalactose transaminase
MADMDAILRLAGKYGLTVIEDACQAHGAEYFSKETQSLDEGRLHGPCGCVQLLPGKKPRSVRRSRGGDHERCRYLADKIKMLRDHGQAKKYHHDVEGYNGRLDAIQAGLLHAKLAHLAKWNTSAATGSRIQPPSGRK